MFAHFLALRDVGYNWDLKLEHIFSYHFVNSFYFPVKTVC